MPCRGAGPPVHSQGKLCKPLIALKTLLLAYRVLMRRSKGGREQMQSFS